MDYKTFKFKVYRHKRNRHLHQQIEAFASPYNHLLALRKRCYRIYGKSPLNPRSAMVAAGSFPLLAAVTPDFADNFVAG